MSAYSPYELLRTLIDRVAWPTQGEQAAAHESVNEYERINMFGNLAQMMACTHEDTVAIPSRSGGQFRCLECGRMVNK